MPLLLKTMIEPEGIMGVWHTTEDDAWLQDALCLTFEEKHELNILSIKRKSEWLSSRHLLNLLTGGNDRTLCLKDEFGKPFLKDSDYHISISHSKEYSGVIISKLLVGIDIQVLSPKMEKIASKFVSANEFNFIKGSNSLEKLHVIWCAKEAMYKAYGKKELDFKKDLSVSEFNFSFQEFIFEGRVKKKGYNEKFTLFCHHFKNVILVYAINQ